MALRLQESLPAPAPFVKWVGGKGKLSPTLEALLPPGWAAPVCHDCLPRPEPLPVCDAPRCDDAG